MSNFFGTMAFLFYKGCNMFSISDIRNDKPTTVVGFIIACLNRNRVVELCEGVASIENPLKI